MVNEVRQYFIYQKSLKKLGLVYTKYKEKKILFQNLKTRI